MKQINSHEKFPIPDIMHLGSKILRFTVEGEPVPQERPRFYMGHAYDPPSSRKYKAKVAEVAKAAVDEAKWMLAEEGCPIKIKIVMFKSFAVATPLWERAAYELGFLAPLKKTGDIENIAKGIMDACTGIVYRDDCQVYSLNCEMRSSFYPRVEVTVEAMFVSLYDVKEAGITARERPEIKEIYEEIEMKEAVYKYKKVADIRKEGEELFGSAEQAPKLKRTPKRRRNKDEKIEK